MLALKAVFTYGRGLIKFIPPPFSCPVHIVVQIYVHNCYYIAVHQLMDAHKPHCGIAVRIGKAQAIKLN